MRAVIIALTLVLCGLGVGATVPRQAYAASTSVDVVSPACKNANPNNLPAICQQGSDAKQTGNPLFGPNGVLTIIIRIVALIIGFIAVVMIIAAGLKMILAGGDAADLKEARATLAHALAALAVAALAEVFVGFVLSKIP